MIRSDYFRFTEWVVENYRKVGSGYVRKGDRVTETSNSLRMDELFELWTEVQRHMKVIENDGPEKSKPC